MWSKLSSLSIMWTNIFRYDCSNGHKFQRCNKTFLPIFIADGAKCWSLSSFHINDTTIDEWTQLRTLIKILGGCTCTFCGWHSLFFVCFFFVCVYVTYSLLDFLLLLCCCVVYITDFYSTCCVLYYLFFIEQRFIVMILFAIFVYMHRKWIWAWRKNFIFLLFYYNMHMYAYSQENVLWQKETAPIHPSIHFVLFLLSSCKNNNKILFIIFDFRTLLVVCLNDFKNWQVSRMVSSGKKRK